MKTFKEFTDTLRGEIWPAGEAKTLKVSHTKQFMAALTDLQKNVSCLQKYNASTFPKCARYWEDGATVVQQPNGVVRRVFTIANGEWRDKVFFWPENYWQLQRWQKRLWEAVTPANLGLSSLPQGFRFDDGTVDSTIGRARVGIWTIYRQRIYVAPWLQSNETLVVEWDGIKDTWVDGDGIDELWWTVDVQEAVKLYVKWKHEFDYGEKSDGPELERAYFSKRADLMLECLKKTEQQQRKEIPESIQYLQQSTIDDDVAPAAASSQFVTCLIGDWGDDNPNTDAVIAQMFLQSPNLIVTLGDNVYDANDPETLFAKFGTDVPVKPCWGNHDWSDVAPNDLSALLGLFDLPNNERYYDFVDGPVHYFVLDSDDREPDGGYIDATTSTQGSVMAIWLKVKMAVSTAKWKVVILHHSPYMSDASYTPGIRYMRWPFKTWGADVVMSGHGHVMEHVQTGSLDYFVCGIGGKELRAFGANTTGTILKQFDSDYGFLKLVSGCSDLVISLIDKQGEEQYSYTITK
jgi:hypothetical protein